MDKESKEHQQSGSPFDDKQGAASNTRGSSFSTQLDKKPETGPTDGKRSSTTPGRSSTEAPSLPTIPGSPNNEAKNTGPGQKTKLSPPHHAGSISDIRQSRQSTPGSPPLSKLERNRSSGVDLAYSTTVIIEKTPVGSYKKTVPTSQVREPKTCFQRFWKVLLSLLTDMSLLIVVGFYTVLGGFLFKHIESGNTEALEVPITVPKKRMQLVLKIFGTMETPEYYNLTQAQHWRNETLELLQEFEVEVAKESLALAESHTDPWTLASSILFSVTLITTIGYGNIAPKTVTGKLCTIAYSLFGIPLTLLYLTNIGGTMASIFKWFYEVIMKLLHGKKVRAERSEVGGGIRVPVTVTSIVILGYICLGAMIFAIWEQKWSIIDSAYFCFITLSTIGLGDYVFGFDEDSQNSSKQLVSSLYLIFGLSLLSMGFNLLQDEIINKYLQLMTRMGMREKKRPRQAS